MGGNKGSEQTNSEWIQGLTAQTPSLHRIPTHGDSQFTWTHPVQSGLSSREISPADRHFQLTSDFHT